MKALALLFAVVALGCGSEPTGTPRPAPGEEPIETASLDDEEIVPLAPEPEAKAKERPCLLVGVGGARDPRRIDEATVRLPPRDSAPRGEIEVEIEILPDGSVGRAEILSTTEPPWPEGERAVLEAVKAWRYEPPALGGTPISLCATIVIRP
jgi:TonB family protein